MACSTAASGPRPELAEPARRRPGASGLPIRLADGCAWLLAVPLARATGGPFTDPDLDGEIDRIFESSALSGEVLLVDAWSAARALLAANYELDDAEFVDLVCGCDSSSFVTTVTEALFGPAGSARSYTDWARASLLANGIVPATIRPGDLANVLTILVATRRTIPASQFVDASRAAAERSALEGLV